MSNSKELKLSNQFQELSKNEMSEVNGGGILGAIVGAIVGVAVQIVGKATISDSSSTEDKVGFWAGVGIYAAAGAVISACF